MSAFEQGGNSSQVLIYPADNSRHFQKGAKIIQLMGLTLSGAGGASPYKRGGVYIYTAGTLGK